jgi:hypothetical protein
MFYEFLLPFDKEKYLGDIAFKPNQIGHNATFYTNTKIDLGQFDLAIIGIEEHRGNENNKGVEDGHFNIRRELYKLYLPDSDKPFRLVDLGNM